MTRRRAAAGASVPGRHKIDTNEPVTFCRHQLTMPYGVGAGRGRAAVAARGRHAPRFSRVSYPMHGDWAARRGVGMAVACLHPPVVREPGARV